MSFARLTGLRLGLNRSSAIGRPHATRLATSIRFASTSGTSEKSASPSLRRNGILALSLLAGAAATYYYDRYVRVSTTTTHTPGGTPVETSAHGPTFEVSIRSSRGPVKYNFRRLPERDIEAKLHSNESSSVVDRPGNPVVRWDRNWVGSNEPCEDRSAIDIVPRSQSWRDTQRWWKWNWGGVGASAAAEASTPGSKDIMMFSVLDGHAGDATSQLLSKTLHPTLTLALAGLQAGISPTLGISKWSQLASYLDPAQWLPGGIWTPENVSRTIQSAYLQLDENICQAPISLLPVLSSQPIKPSDPDSEVISASDIFTAQTDPANAGACAISAVVDAEEDGLWVALAGDCRAVAGWEGVDGKWRCDVLTEDQMGENPREVERMKSEHPRSEASSVIRNGRVQGGLQPTRAFGDAVYKWTSEQNSAMERAYAARGLKLRKERPGHLTPPYVTARPEVTYRQIHPSSGERLRFLVMATDGLWDRITSEEATLLVASYLSHPNHPDIPKVAIPNIFPLQPPLPESQRPYPVQDLPGTGDRAAGSWVYEGDENAATHLIRNSLAGGDRKLRGELLSMHGGVTRWMRDDITVTVVFFNGQERGRGATAESLE
ncbi:hypothetical protein EHS25_002077 [Saitozyma podzolica]|uniref:PPM-type phosphatase domain-containing protein n=1 Tax=Saitozyma podzolica TaxID=1890683 RepID=A0A427YEX1_9TREE|nr:hypothetical protein EHS25_002077 [Saitozyma podzolica]